MPFPEMPSESSAASSSHARRVRRGLLVAALPAMFSACVTVNLYFPAPEIQAAAEKIVEETWGSATGEAAAGEPRSSLAVAAVYAALRVVGASEAHAAEVDVEISTAAIRALKDAMRTRSAELKPFLGTGAVGVGKDGLLAAREAPGLDLAAKARVRRLVEAENRDREALYREIASANDYGAERVADIRRIFAGTWRDKAEAGWWIQADDGAWRQR